MRLIDADALIEKWYEVNNIGPEDRGAIFIGYTEIPRFINNAPTVEPTGDIISRADAIEAVESSYKEPLPISLAYPLEDIINILKALPSADAEFTDLPDIPRYYYEKVVGNMAHEINMLKEQLESADAAQGEWVFNPTDAIDLMFAKPKCSRCGFESSDGGNFCPNCGSRMESEE